MPLPSQVVPADPAQDRAARHGKVLEELAEIGLDLARALSRQVAEADTPANAGEVALAYSRLARAVRLTLALEDRLAQGHAARARAAEDERAEIEAERDRARANARHDAAIGRDLVRTMVEEAIEAETDADADGREAEPLLAALREKLDEVDEEDFAQLPVDAIVMRICKDLGVPYDPALWDDEDDPAPCERPTQPYWDAPRKPIPVWDPATCRFQPP